MVAMKNTDRFVPILGEFGETGEYEKVPASPNEHENVDDPKYLIRESEYDALVNERDVLSLEVVGHVTYEHQLNQEIGFAKGRLMQAFGPKNITPSMTLLESVNWVIDNVWTPAYSQPFLGNCH